MATTVNVLTVGSSASLLYLAWRLQVSKSCRIYSAKPWSKIPISDAINNGTGPTKVATTTTGTASASGPTNSVSNASKTSNNILATENNASLAHLSTTSSSGSSTSSTHRDHQEGLITPPSSSSSLNTTHNTELTFDSKQFGSSSKFYPDFCYEDVSEIESSLQAQVQFDVILVSLDNLRQISKLAKQLARVANRNTIILFDGSSGIPYISNLIKNKFINTGIYSFLGLFMCDEFIVQTQNNRFSHLKASSFNGSGQTIITDIDTASSTGSASSIIRDFVFYLQSAGCNALYQHSKDEFYLLQWQRAIATVSLQPLSIIMDIPDLNALSRDVMAKPIYEGLMNELYTIATSQLNNEAISNRLFPLPQAMTNFDWIPVPEKVDSNSCSLLYYQYYSRMDFPCDIYLLQPILLGDELGVKTPYLEFLFAQMSKLILLNREPSFLFQRNLESSTSSSSASLKDIASANAAAAEALTAREELLSKREKEFARRDQDLSRREASFRRELQSRPPSHMVQSPTYPIAQTPVQQYQFQQQSMAPINPNGATSRRHSYTPMMRQTSQMETQHSPMQQQQQQPQAASALPQDINMMSITQRKNRRNPLARSMSNRNINALDIPLTAPDATSRRDSLVASPSSPSLRSPVYTNNNRHSQTMELSDIISPGGDDRYGKVSSRSAGSKAPSRPHSVVGRHPPQGPSFVPQSSSFNNPPEMEQRNFVASSSQGSSRATPQAGYVAYSQQPQAGYAAYSQQPPAASDSETHKSFHRPSAYSEPPPKLPTPHVSQSNLLDAEFGPSLANSLSAFIE